MIKMLVGKAKPNKPYDSNISTCFRFTFYASRITFPCFSRIAESNRWAIGEVGRFEQGFGILSKDSHAEILYSDCSGAQKPIKNRQICAGTEKL